MQQGAVAELARRRARGIRSLEVSWTAALRRLASVVGQRDLERLALALPTPDSAAALSPWFGESEQALARLDAAVEDSAFELTDWLSALYGLAAHLREEGLSAPLEQALGYVAGAEAAIETIYRGASLPQALALALDEHGFHQV